MMLLVMVLAVVVAGHSTSAQTFKDVKPSATYYDAVEHLAEIKAIQTTTGTFNPSGTVTRGQASKILAITLGLDTTNVKDPGFKDVPKGSSYYPYVAALQNANIINGKEPTRFGVNDYLTRGQMAKILVKGFGLPEFELDNIFENEPAVAIGNETRKYVSPLYFYGITTGNEKGNYGASDKLKRSQLAAFVYRTYNIMEDIKNDVYINFEADGYQYPESTVFDVADIVAVGHDGGFLLRPYKAGNTAIYYGDKTLVVTVAKNLTITYEEVSSVPESLKAIVSDYRYYDYDVVSATAYDSKGEVQEDLTPKQDLTSLSFLSRDTKNYTRIEVILENGDVYEYFVNAVLDSSGRYYVTQLYEVGQYISFYYFYNFGGALQVTLPDNSGLAYTTDDSYITFKATKVGKYKVTFGADERGIEVINVNGELAVREYDLSGEGWN